MTTAAEQWAQDTEQALLDEALKLVPAHGWTRAAALSPQMRRGAEAPAAAPGGLPPGRGGGVPRARTPPSGPRRRASRTRGSGVRHMTYGFLTRGT